MLPPQASGSKVVQARGSDCLSPLHLAPHADVGHIKARSVAYQERRDPPTARRIELQEIAQPPCEPPLEKDHQKHASRFACELQTHRRCWRLPIVCWQASGRQRLVLGLRQEDLIHLGPPSTLAG